MAHMNGGFEKHGLDDDAFGPKGGFSNLKTFDAFRKRPSFILPHRDGAIASSTRFRSRVLGDQPKLPVAPVTFIPLTLRPQRKRNLPTHLPHPAAANGPSRSSFSAPFLPSQNSEHGGQARKPTTSASSAESVTSSS
jgi:hypothetical protein